MSIKLIASDIDGTLIPYRAEPSERTRSAVRACRERGVVFTVATGRWFIPAQMAARSLGQTDGYIIIASGGAVVSFDGEPLREWGIPDERAQEAYALLRKYDVMINSFIRNNIYRVNTQAYGRRLSELDSYLGGAYRVHTDDYDAFEREALKRPYKMEAYSHHPEDLHEIAGALREIGFSVTSSYHTNIEFAEPNMGKGTAVKWLANHLGIQRDECMAMGDNTNDLSLLNAVGWPIAMGNAVDELKAAARLIAPNSESNGAAIMIERALEDKL